MFRVYLQLRRVIFLLPFFHWDSPNILGLNYLEARVLVQIQELITETMCQGSFLLFNLLPKTHLL